MKNRVFLLTFFLIFILAPFCIGHAVPVSITPSEEFLKRAPETISIQFNERVEPATSGISLIANGGSPHRLNVSVPGPNLLIAPLPLIKNGTVYLSWYVQSRDDGHFTSGSIRYIVGEPQTTSDHGPNTSIQLSEHRIDAILIFIEHLCLALIFAWALLAFLSSGRTPPVKEPLIRQPWIILASVFALFSSISLLLLTFKDLQTATWSGATGLIPYFSSTIGIEGLIRALLILILTIFILFKDRMKHLLAPQRYHVIIITALLGIAMCRAILSHASASPVLPWVSITIAGIHLLFKELWVGMTILLCLSIIYKRSELHNLNHQNLHRTCTISLALTLLTGGFMIAVDLKDFANLTTTPWGNRLLIITPLIMIGLLLRTTLMHQSTHHTRSTESFISRAIRAEALVAITVLGMSSLMMVTSPPLLPPQLIGEANSGATTISVFNDQPFPLLTFTDMNHQPVTIKSMIVTLDDSIRGINHLPIHTMPDGVGRARLHLSPGERGTLDITGVPLTGYDATATITIPGPSASPHFKTRFIAIITILTILASVIPLWQAHHGRDHPRLTN